MSQVGTAIDSYRTSTGISRVSDLGFRYRSSKSLFKITLFLSSISKASVILKRFFAKSPCFGRFVLKNAAIDYFLLASGDEFCCCVFDSGGLERKAMRTLQQEIKRCQVVGPIDRDVLKRYQIVLPAFIEQPKIPDKRDLPEIVGHELIPEHMQIVTNVLGSINSYLYEFRVLIHGEIDIPPSDGDHALEIRPCDQYSDDDLEVSDSDASDETWDQLKASGIVTITGGSIVCNRCGAICANYSDATQHVMSHYFQQAGEH